MTLSGDVPADRRWTWPSVLGPAGSVAVAVALFTRFGINGVLSRDEAIYTYAGQQLAHGVAPYTSIFDPKNPLPTVLAGAAAGLADAVGRNDIYAIRAAYFLTACLTVLAIYLLAARLFRSVVAGVVAAVVFASFTGFAEDALSGPDAKTPGILLAVVSMWFLVRRRYVLGALAGSFAFLVWQPLVFYPAVAVGLAALDADPGRRLRSAAVTAGGALAPVVATVIAFAVGGALGDFVETTLSYPATGVVRDPVTFAGRFTHISDVIDASYGVSGALLWTGMAGVVVLSAIHLRRARKGGFAGAWRDPLIAVVLVTGLAEMAYAIYDFQGYPDVYPLLPYGAIGVGGLAAGLMRLARDEQVRRAIGAGALAAVTVLAGFSWVWFGDNPMNGGFRAQRADTCALQRLLGDGGRLVALGNPVYLVTTHRRNPDRFIYLEAGVDQWKVDHTTGGLAGWVRQLQSADPTVIAIGSWFGPLRDAMGVALKQAGYRARYVGGWRVFLTPAAVAAARQSGVRLTRLPTAFATGPAGHELPGSGCG